MSNCQLYNGQMGPMCDHMVVGLAITNVPMQSMPITTKVVSLNPAHGEMYSIQHYVIKLWFRNDRTLTKHMTVNK
jgi:hypothetical protein